MQLPTLGIPAPTRPQAPTRLNLQVPKGIAARDGTVVLADMGLRQLLRLDHARDNITPMASLAPGTGPALHLAADGSVWLAESASGLVRQMDRNGRVIRSWQDDRFASRPVAVSTLVDSGGDVFVADGSLSHVAVFDAFGKVIRRFGQGQLQSVVAMTSGPLGLYVLDRLAQQVMVFDRNGRALMSMGDSELVFPFALAVDAAGRVFVADETDGAIHVFVDGERVARFKGDGVARFARIEALAVDGNLLYVTDGVSAQIQILLISPESLRRPSRP